MLTKRQLLILQAIIDDFIANAKPVGSRAISKKEAISFSAATIRNEMADLEEMGFLEKTHSSSGRIPSERGYRYYVDYVIVPSLQKNNLSLVQNIMKDGFYELEQMIQRSAEVLSELTSYTSIILGPEIFEAKLKQLQIVTLSKYTAVAILITDTGHVEHRSFSIPAEINPMDLEKMVNILNDRLRGVPLFRLRNILNNEIITLMKVYLDDFAKSYEYIKSAFFSEQPTNLYIGGKSNMLLQPEFKDVDKFRTLYSILEDESELTDLIKNDHDGINVTIGQENKLDVIKDFSLITASYHLGSEKKGTIALLGPTRMEYRKVINLLNALSLEMTDVLNLWYKND